MLVLVLVLVLVPLLLPLSSWCILVMFIVVWFLLILLVSLSELSETAVAIMHDDTCPVTNQSDAQRLSIDGYIRGRRSKGNAAHPAHAVLQMRVPWLTLLLELHDGAWAQATGS